MPCSPNISCPDLPNATGRTMGLSYGLNDSKVILKRKFRWLFYLRNISADDSGINCLPHRRGARPSIGWKEVECQHLTETIMFPLKPDWKPVPLILYDLRCNYNIVFEWLRQNENLNGAGMYDPSTELNNWQPIVPAQLKRDATLKMLDGCGQTIECWTFENCYPTSIDWGELDMDSSDFAMVEIQLRYDRAWMDKPPNDNINVNMLPPAPGNIKNQLNNGGGSVGIGNSPGGSIGRGI